MLLLACASPPDSPPADSAPDTLQVPYSHSRAPLDERSAGGRPWRRAIVHLHSTLSHDACDNHEGERSDEECEASLRQALCDAAIDFAFLTDHPSTAAEHSYEELFGAAEDDEILGNAAVRSCAGGHGVSVLPGIEDELMPLALDAHVATTAEENDAIYNDTSATTFDAVAAAGGMVWQAHTEGKSSDELDTRVALGLAGAEMFNLHAMVDPTKREEDLGLDAFAYLDAIGPFITGETAAEPDLGFLAFYEEQLVSIEKWDQLNQTSFVPGTAGTDAHENALPFDMSDGERVDSYRRMMSWFSNVLLVDGDGADAAEAALRAGRFFVSFDALGIPSGFDVAYGSLEMGGEAALGERLVVSCPTLADSSPQMGETPEISVQVLKDGAPWQSGCGEWSVEEAGVYRVRVDIVPWQLTSFLDDQQSLIRSYPWLYSNPLRIGL